MHAWHDVTPGQNLPAEFLTVVEIPRGSSVKYELDKQTGLLKLDRILYSSVHYPANYGFIPQTYCDDKDPLDILVISQVKIVPLCMVEAKVIGVMRMIDGGEADDKIIAVAQGDPSVSHIEDISQLPEHFISEMRNFFEDYKKLEHKTVVVEEFQDKSVAEEIVRKAVEDYKAMFGK